MPVDPAGGATRTIGSSLLSSGASLPRWILAATGAVSLLIVLARFTVAADLGSAAELPALLVACGGSVLALYAAHRREPHALDLRPLMAGLALTGVAVYLADAAQSPGLTTSSLVANGCILLASAVMYPIILRAFYRDVNRRQALSMVIDGLIVLTAGTTALLVVWFTGTARSPEPADYLLPFLGVLVLASALMAVLAALTRRAAPAPRGIWISIIGTTLLALCWVIWFDRAFRLQPPGPLIAPLYCPGVIAVSYGWITWTFEPGGGATYKRLAGSLADWLPIIGILACLGLAAYPHARISGWDPAAMGTAAVIVLAIGRQQLLVLAERSASRRLAAEISERAQAVAGAQGQLYESIAQELVGSLGPELREFLVRVSPVDEIDPTIASMAAALPEERTIALLGAAQRLGLISHGQDPAEPWRLNPILTEYLQARFASEVGHQGVIDLHRKLAVALEPTSWRQAARHWAAAGDYAAMRRVIGESILTIVARGDFAAATDLVTRFPEPTSAREAACTLVRSYQLASTGRFGDAVAHLSVAEQLGDASPSGAMKAAVSLTRIHFGTALADESVRQPGIDDLRNSEDPEFKAIGRAAEWLWGQPERVSVSDLCVGLSEIARLAALRGHLRLEGLALLRLSIAQAGRCDWGAATESGRVAVARLEAHGLADERARARLALARALAPSPGGTLWRQQAAIVLHDKGAWLEPSILAELAELEALYGDPSEARRIASLPLPETVPALPDRRLRETRARIQMLEGDPAAAITTMADLERDAPLSLHVRSVALAAQAFVSPESGTLHAELAAAGQEAERREQSYLQKTLMTTQASISSPGVLNRHVHELESETAHLSSQAELLTRRLNDLDARSFELVRRDAALRPERWRRPLRRLLETERQSLPDISRGTDLLELVGTPDDLELLQGVARDRRLKVPEAGRSLAKRLAPPVYIDDLGRITITIGDRTVDGTAVRRKVLALLAYMMTRPQFTATRDEAIEALWPDTDVEQGSNSLNQACHVLRHVFEPQADGGLSAGYLNNKADLIWLDSGLVSSRSGECLRLLSAMEGDPSPDLVRRLVETYTSRFAVDFLYEDWASSFRDRLHTSFLAQIERSIELDIEAGAFHRAVNIAQMTMAVDPTAKQVELDLVRLYRLIGASDAAARQYAPDRI